MLWAFAPAAAQAQGAAFEQARAGAERIIEHLVQQACRGADECEYRAELTVLQLDDDDRPDFLLSIPPLSCVASICEARVYLAKESDGHRLLTSVQGHELQPGEDRSGGLLNLWSLLYMIGEEPQDEELPRVVAETPVAENPHRDRMVMEVLRWSGTAYVPAHELRHAGLRLAPMERLARSAPGTVMRARPAADAEEIMRYPSADAYLEVLGRWTEGPWLLVRLRRLDGAPVVGYVPRESAFDIQR